MDKYINQIINADCLDILKELPDKCIDLVLTDPPYGMFYERHIKYKKFDKILNDDNLNWLDLWCNLLSKKVKENAHLYIFCSWHNIDIFKSTLSKYFHFKNLLIWNKNCQGMGDLRTDYGCSYEFICFCTATKKNMKSLNGKRDNNIINIQNDKNEIHPTQKPVGLMSYLIDKSTNENDIVLDTFAGSCPVAIACHNLKRRFICVEKNEDYYKASVERLKDAQSQLKLF